MLYLTSYLDKWGSGVERIVQLCKEANIPMPAYSVANRLVTQTFYRLALSDDTKSDTKSKRTIRQQEIIKLVAENSTISIATLALRLKVSKN